MTDNPQVSVIIPTHNRVEAVVMAVEALGRQSVAEWLYDIVVVADGCKDGTAERLRALDLRCNLKVLEIADNRGPANARNTGASEATAPLLLFLDDDIVVTEDFIAGHLAAHRNARVGPTVVIGYLPVRLTGQTGLFAVSLLDWWESMFDRIAGNGHRFEYSDLLSGNFSIPREFFMRVGGFENELRCHEDYELGYRLIEAGAAFAFSRQAKGYHCECTDLRRSLRRKSDEGLADAWLARKYPALRPRLLLGTPAWGRGERIRRLLALRSQWLGSAFEAGAAMLMFLAGMLRIRSLWARALSWRLSWHYWRGAAAAIGSNGQIEDLCADHVGHTEESTLDLQLADGLQQCAARLDAERPSAARLWFAEALVTVISATPGAERLHGGHLARVLGQHALEFTAAVGLRRLQTDASLSWSSMSSPDAG